MPKNIDDILKEISGDIVGKLKGDKGDSPSESEILYLILKVFKAYKSQLKGQKGDKGDKPIAGKDYPIPKPGKNGIDGIDGINGKNPKDGEDGFTPRHEIKDGKLRFENPDKTWGEWIDFEKLVKEAVSGLRPQVFSTKKILGGQVGTWWHESFDTTSATTSITLEHGIASYGNAIFLRYNGQLLAKDVQYTVLGSVISFTFTLDDNSKVDVTYAGSI